MSQAITDNPSPAASLGDEPNPEVEKKPLLDERSWKILLRSIKEQRCTPFLGPEMAFGEQPFHSAVAYEWALEYGYPLDDSDDLARVAQFIATEYDLTYPKYEFITRVQRMAAPDFNNPAVPHSILAGLQLPLYVMTTFDDFLYRALETSRRDPRREVCRWNDFIPFTPSVFDATDKDGKPFQPTPANPVVFHLYGHTETPTSLVLTEDDHLDFLAHVAQDPGRIHPRIQATFTSTLLLFLGYRLSDLDFRVLLRSLTGYLKKNVYYNSKAHVSVQVVAVGEEVETDKRALIEQYLSKYCDQLAIRTCLAPCCDFLAELQQRWTRFAATGGINDRI